MAHCQKTQNGLATALRVLAPLVILLAAALPSWAEEITTFHSVVNVQSDAMLDVTEELIVDFDAPRHGIYRFIPVEYSRMGNKYTTDFKLLGVKADGRDAQYSTSRQGKDVSIKIGNPNTTLTGEHTYTINYSIRRAMNFFDGEPEVYWNATGNQATMPVKHAICDVVLPSPMEESKLRAISYVGPAGSQQNGAYSIHGNVVTFTADSLAPGEGLTVVVRLPKGSIARPSQMQEFLWFLDDWWPLFTIPATTLGIMLIMYWYTGRDVIPNMPVAVEWSPPKNLSPAEVGTLVDERCDMTDIVSTLIDLAARGYLKIRQTIANDMLFFSKHNYVFTKLPEPKNDAKLLPYEKIFLNGLFENAGPDGTVYLSDLKERFYVHLTGIECAIYDSLVQKGMFLQSPRNVRHSWQGIGILLLFCALFGAAVSSAWGFGFALSGLLVLFMSGAMPARTEAGCVALNQCRAFQRFVTLAEKERLRVLAKDDPTIFGRLLPFAMVLGAADKWAHAFQDLMTRPPDWYEPYGYGTPGYHFSAGGFVDDLGAGMRTMGTTFSSTPPPQPTSSAGSGGSGFNGGSSGGGFGGGGTSSW
ncbi:MAG TPA: DUF2207 domain-containing protein [Candidatus Obscuribacterales bacterium]